MKQIIRLQRGLAVSNVNKASVFSTHHVSVFPSPARLFTLYLSSAINRPVAREQYHEYTTESMNPHIKFFLDIDLTRNVFEEHTDFCNYRKNNPECTDLELIQGLVVNITNYIVSESHIKPIPENDRSLFGFVEASVEPLALLQQHASFEEEEYKPTPPPPEENEEPEETSSIISNILKNVSVTRSNDPSKVSFHIFFNNLIIRTDTILSIKSFIKRFISSCKNPIAGYIDTHVYRKNNSLRFIYSDKENYPYVHEPLVTTFEDNLFQISYEVLELTEQNISLFTYTYMEWGLYKVYLVTPTASRSSRAQKDNSLASNRSFVLDDDNNIAIEKLADIDYLTLEQILNSIIKEKDLAIISVFNGIRNISDFDNRLYKDFKGTLDIEFNYQDGLSRCLFCSKKSSHKSPHSITINNHGIIVFKKERMQNCSVKSFLLPPLSEYKICDWLFRQGVIKRLSGNEIIVFSKVFGWIRTSRNDYSNVKAVLNQNKHFFKPIDRVTIEKISEKCIRENMDSVMSLIPHVELLYHNLFKFSNGVLDMKRNVFVPMEDSIDLVILDGVDYPYKPIAEYSEDELSKDAYLRLVLEQIIPYTLNGEKNPDREVFERNLSTCIMTCPKDIITVFQGETSAGKSTVKNLVAKTLGSAFIELTIDVYTNKLDPNRPNPWLGKIDMKLCSFASESAFSDKINSQTVKLMTEVTIQARVLHSNEQKQTNCLTQFIDTNHELEFDSLDTATLRRWAVVHFRTHFKASDTLTILVSDPDKTCVDGSLSLKNDILLGKYKLVFFNILLEWARKYNHFECLGMKHTADESGFSKIQSYFRTYHIETPAVPIDKIHVIKESALSDYTTISRVVDGKKVDFIVSNWTTVKERMEAVARRHNWKEPVQMVLSNARTIIKSRSIVISPVIFLGDIKPEFRETIVQDYNNKVKGTKNPPFDIDKFNSLYKEEFGNMCDEVKENIKDALDLDDDEDSS